MYRFKNAFKKTTALVVASVLVLSLFSGSFSTLAAELSEILSYSFESPGVVTDCDLMNDLAELELPAEIIGAPQAAINNGTTSTSTSFGNNATLTDYTISEGADSTGKHFYTLKEGKAHTDTTLDSIEKWNEGAYTQLIIPFKTPIKLKHIVIAGMHRNANWRTGEYEIYASTGRGELFLPESVVYKRDNTADKNQVELYSFKDGKELRYINYIAVRIYKPHATYDLSGNNLDSAIRPRLFEFNAYGTPENADYSLTQDFTVNYDTNSINLNNTVSSKTTSFTYTLDGVTSPISSTNGGQITDYDFTKGGWFAGAYQVYFDPAPGKSYTSTDVNDIGTRHVNGLNKNTGNEQYVTIETELLSEVDIEDILVVNHSQSYLMTGLYEIFASSSKADLYKNSVVCFDNTSVKKQIQDIHFDTDKELKGIRYVAMRIYNPMTDWFGSQSQGLYSNPNQMIKAVYPRIMEFNVYGSWSNPDFDPDAYTLNLNTNSIDTTKTFNWNSAKYEFTDETGTTSVSMAEGGAKIYDYKYDTGDYLASNKRYFDLKDGYGVDSTDINAIKTKYTDGTRYLTITLEAETEMNLSDIVLVNHPNDVLRTKDYEIFASDKLSTLFEKSSSVLRYDNTAGEQIQNIHYAEGKELSNIKYIALRIYDPVNSWQSQGLINIIANQGVKAIYPRIMEFNAYGVYSDPNYQPPAFKVYGSMDKIDTTKTFQKALTVTFTKDGKTEKVAWTGQDKINDSLINTGAEFHYSSGTKFFDVKDGYAVNDTDGAGVGTKYIDGSRYLDLTYKFPTEAKVSDILIVQHHAGGLMLGNYKVYVSNNLDTLYTDENLIGEYDSAGGSSQIQNYHWDEGNELTGIKFVGMRLTNPFANWDSAISGYVPSLGLKTLYPRIMEFNVYGEYEDPNFVPEVLTDTANFDLSTLPTYGTNLVHNIKPSFFAEGIRAGVRPATVNDISAKVSEPPSNENAHYDISDPALKNKEYFDIQWKLQDIYKLEQYRVKGFAYQGIFRDMPEHYAYHYQIYVAADAEDLYKPENMVFEYNAEERGVMKGVVYEFPANNAPVGGYIALRIIKPSNGATVNANARLSIFYVWGEDPQIIPEPTNLAENMPIDAYFSKGKMEEISESNLTAKEVMNMTDASESTVAKIDTKADKRKTTEFIYNLCGDMIIDKIALNVLNNSTTGFKTMKVYTSDTLAGVNQDKALIWTQSMSGKTGNVNLSKTITSKDEIRYVRFVFEGCKDYLQINTINIEGLDNQKNKTRELTSTLDMNSHVDIKNINLETGGESSLSFNSSAKSAIFDAVAQTYPVVAHEGIVGKNEFEIVIQMDDLRTINQMKLSKLYGFDEYYADTINVYIAEVFDEISGKNKKTEPDYVIKKEDFKNQVFEAAMRPRLVRFMKFEFKGFSKIEGTQLPDSNDYMLTSIIPDMSFKGTKVKGMQTSAESETLISFEDKKTGIKADIIRLDTNDIFTDAAGIKVTPEKATNWQMMSLKHNPYLKVVDKTNYKIEFVDIYGNTIRDLKGRNIDIRFTVPKGENAEEFMVGDASVRTKMLALETAPVNNTVTAGLVWNRDVDNKVALLQIVNDDDPYWDTIGELEDFSEGTEEDLKGDVQEEEHDADWYKTIRTEDGRFEVTGVDTEIEAGVKFTATDISEEVTDEFYELIASISGGKQVAAVYDFAFTLNDEVYTYDGIVDIKLNLPDFIKDNYTDLQIIHLLSETSATLPWCETIDDEFHFQAESFSNFVIIGTARDSSVGNPIGSLDAEDGVSPSTGENGITLPVLMGIVAAAFVILTSTRKKVR